MKNNRWQIAQEYEKQWWDKRKELVSLNFYRHFAEDLTRELHEILKIEKSTCILEIGSGAAGTITFLNSEKKYAIDPLEDYYSTIKEFTKDRDNRVKYLNAKGEELPFKDSFFDLIIIDNVLDHCSRPEKVISEIRRTLRPGGIIFLRQNTYHYWGIFIRKIMELFIYDKGHPFTFSKSQLEKLFNKYELRIIKFSRTGYCRTWLKELKSLKKKEIAKAFLFTTRDKTLYILQK